MQEFIVILSWQWEVGSQQLGGECRVSGDPWVAGFKLGYGRKRNSLELRRAQRRSARPSAGSGERRVRASALSAGVGRRVRISR